MTRSQHQSSLRRQRGVSVITAVFLLLLLAGLAALMANVISTSHTTSAQDVLGARAYQAARAGVEWGLYRVFEAPAPADTETINASGGCAFDVIMPRCPSAAFPVADIDGFAVVPGCQQFPAAHAYEEGCRRIRIFRLAAIARGPGPAGLTVEREVQVTAEKCLDATTGRDC